MSGIGRTAKEIEYHSKVISLGCIACEKLGEATIWPLNIHHTDGRKQKKEGDYSEWRVICLCEQHHNPALAFSQQDIYPDLDLPSVHGRKKLFHEKVGYEKDLVEETFIKLNVIPPWGDSAEVNNES